MSDDETVLETGIRAGVLDTTLDILRTCADEAVLKLGKDGLDTSVVDPANIYLHHLSIAPAAFEFTPSGQFALGTNLERLHDAIGKADPNDTVTLAFNTATRRLNVSYRRVDMDLAGIDPDSIRNEPDNPDLDHPNEVTLAGSQLADGLDVVDLVSDHVIFTFGDDGDALVMTAEGDIDTARYTLARDEVEALEVNAADATSYFSMDYATDLAAAVQGDVTLLLGEEVPLKALHEYDDGHATVESMIAPRIVND